jgi:2-polyprenyl-3-methyl-5-hydroxy-6-metoxy-1,4-benzoquinol methylase
MNSIAREAAARTGDQIAIPGDYQYRARYDGFAPQRFWHHAVLSEAEHWLSPEPGDLILDVGCGSGLLAARLAESPGTKVVAVDSNPAAISFATHHFQRSNLEFRLGLVDELDSLAQDITKIAFLEVIEHLSPEQAFPVLSTFHRLLRRPGLLVISTPNAHSLWPTIEWALDRSGLIPPMKVVQHVTLYSLASLKDLAERAGFRMIAYRTLNGVAPWLSALNWKLALAMHRLEQARPHRLGSILLAVFEKNDVAA